MSINNNHSNRLELTLDDTDDTLQKHEEKKTENLSGNVSSNSIIIENNQVSEVSDKQKNIEDEDYTKSNSASQHETSNDTDSHTSKLTGKVARKSSRSTSEKKINTNNDLKLENGTQQSVKKIFQTEISKLEEEQTRPLLVRRNTVVEEAEESLRQARKSIALENNRKNSVKDSWVEVKRGIYNPQYREFMSRDCLAWFKLALFYFIFYTVLAAFFVLLLFLFYEFKIDLKTPNLFYKESVMHYKGINPGLGFRPQVDVESELIKVNVDQLKNNLESINLFLGKYERNKLKNFTGAHGRKQIYNFEEYLKGTPCSRQNQFGFQSQAPCVIIKLNRIYGWLPKVSVKAPSNLTKINSTEKFVYVKCEGEHGVDRDNIKTIDYYSPYPNREIGGIPFKYFPFRNQPDYLSPLVFVHFANASKNILINVECKAYARNIDNKDRLNRRGMTKFQLFIN